MNNLTLSDIKDKIAKERANTEDIYLDPSEYKMESDGNVKLVNTNQNLKFTDWAMGQAYTSFGMPGRYEKKLMEVAPNMVAEQFNYWKDMKKDPVLLRTQRVDTNTSIARGFLSKTYSIFNDMDLFDIVEDTKNSFDFGDPKLFYIDDRRMHVRFVVDMPIDAGKPIQKNDIIKVGVDVANSEVGASSVFITPMVYRLICTNGLRAWSATDEAEAFRHSRKDSSEFHNLIGTALRNSISGSLLLADNFIKQRTGKPVIAPHEVLENLMKKEFTNNIIEGTKKAFEEEPEYNWFGIINAITREARSLPDEQRLDLESFAGKNLQKYRPEYGVKQDDLVKLIA